MTYNFHLDAGIYNRKSLFKLVSKAIYHNPVTLESHTVKMAKLYNFFEKTLAPNERVSTTYQLNTVQNDNLFRHNLRIHTDPKLLNALYLKGYNLFHKISPKILKNEYNVCPKDVYLLNNKKKIFNLKKIIKVLKKK